jgi:hypothetical protein
MLAGVLVAIVVVAVLWAIVSDNSLVGQRNQVANGWRQIDVPYPLTLRQAQGER